MYGDFSKNPNKISNNILKQLSTSRKDFIRTFFYCELHFPRGHDIPNNPKQKEFINFYDHFFRHGHPSPFWKIAKIALFKPWLKFEFVWDQITLFDVLWKVSFVNLSIYFASSVQMLIQKWINWIIKVHTFWEGHKILRNLHLTFDCIYCS